MGTKMAPNYAYLFMVNFENKFVFNYSIQPIFYKRYIDDIFFISPSTADELNTFQEHLNKSYPTIRVICQECTLIGCGHYPREQPLLRENIFQEYKHFLVHDETIISSPIHFQGIDQRRKY